MEFLFRIYPELTQFSLLFGRIIVGLIMIYFGWSKIKNLRRNSKDFVKMGFKPGWFWGTPIAFLEFFGGLGMVFGIATTVIASLYAVQMLVGTVWKMSSGKKFPDYSYDLLILALTLLIVALGAGLYDPQLFN